MLSRSLQPADGALVPFCCSPTLLKLCVFVFTRLSLCVCVYSVSYSTPAHTPEGIDLQTKFRDKGLNISRVRTCLQLSCDTRAEFIIPVYCQNQLLPKAVFNEYHLPCRNHGFLVMLFFFFFKT